MIEPNLIFKYWRADEVAECMDGVTDDLYSKLWNDIVPQQSEDFLLGGNVCLANYWHLLSETDQARLNEIEDFNELRCATDATVLQFRHSFGSLSSYKVHG
mgnify:CR=1 FL=1